MFTFDREYFNLGYLDTLSYKDTIIHRIDPRIKLIVTFAFILTVVSFPKYELSGMIPFFIFPVMLFSLGDVPAKFILKKLLVVSPFVIFVGIFNPLFDSVTMYEFYGINISGGWLSFLSIIIKYILTVSAALLLIATTSFPGVCYGLQRLSLPSIFVSQMLFIYRYIFVLMDETMKIVRARNMRSFGNKGTSIKVFINIIGVILIRTIEKAERIYSAMLSRGFDGRLRSSKKYKITFGDIFIALICLSAFYFLRKYNVSVILGNAAYSVF
jgi:cobalt/nickel transport system permease protein